MKVSIIITAFNSRGLLRQLLKGIAHFPPTSEFEVIVVDNNSNDGTKAMMMDEFSEIQYIKLPSNKGLAVANNIGIRKARGEFLLILNPDIALFKGCIDQLLQFAESHPKAGIIAPKLLNPDRSTQLSTYLFPKWYTPILRRSPLGNFTWAQKHLRTYIMKDWPHDRDRTVEWALGAAFLVRRSAMEVVGMQDESFFLYFEDVDWCRRFWKKGFEVWYASAIPFIHYHRRESAEHPGLEGILSTITKIHIRSWITYLRKHGFSRV